MRNPSPDRYGGITTSGLLGIVFVTLKLCGVIHWSWWWVTAPFWGVAALFIVIFVVLAICVFVAKLVE